MFSTSVGPRSCQRGMFWNLTWLKSSLVKIHGTFVYLSNIQEVPSILCKMIIFGQISVPKPEFWIKGILGCNQHHLRWPSIGKCVYMVVLICPDHCPTLLMCFFLLIVIPVSDRITLSDWVVKKWPPNRGGKLRFHHSQKVIGFGGVEDHHQVDADLVATPLKPGSFDIIKGGQRRTQEILKNPGMSYLGSSSQDLDTWFITMG